MVNFSKGIKGLNENIAVALLFLSYITLIELTESVEARDKGDDIILSKGKIIMRGGKGKGNIILDPGSHSSDSHHVMSPMMSLMGHFNPYSFYPMHQHQQHHHQPPVVIHPVYIEDHSAMHHHQPEQHHEEPHHYQHHEMEHHHYEPHHEMHHEAHHEEQHHHEPMDHHYEHDDEGHHEDEDHHHQQHHHQGGYEAHPMMSMMMHGSGLQPAYQQMAAMQALQQPAVYAYHPNPDQQQQAAAYHQARLEAAAAVGHEQSKQQTEQKEASQSIGGGQQQQGSSNKPVISLLEKSANNPLVQIIKPLFKRNKNSTSQWTQNKP